MSSSLKLIATTPDLVGLLAGALAEYGVACQTHGKMVSIDANDANDELFPSASSPCFAMCFPRPSATP